MYMPASTLSGLQLPSAEQSADLRLAASKMTGATRRLFQAEMAVKYCEGNARLAETVFGWGRHTIALVISFAIFHPCGVFNLCSATAISTPVR